MRLQSIETKDGKEEGGERQAHPAKAVGSKNYPFAVKGRGYSFVLWHPPCALCLWRQEAAFLQLLQEIFRHT